MIDLLARAVSAIAVRADAAAASVDAGGDQLAVLRATLPDAIAACDNVAAYIRDIDLRDASPTGAWGDRVVLAQAQHDLLIQVARYRDGLRRALTLVLERLGEDELPEVTSRYDQTPQHLAAEAAGDWSAWLDFERVNPETVRPGQNLDGSTVKVPRG